MVGRLCLPALIAGGVALGGAQETVPGGPGPFPKPVRMVAQVEFWKMVYTQFTTRQALIHDNRDLSVIYDLVLLPSPNWKTAKPAASAAVERYRRILEGLAAGPIDSLSLDGDARRVWELWGRSQDPEVYKRASLAIRAQRCLSDEFRAGLERATRYRDRMRRILRQGRVPEDLWVLTLVESPFELKARSHAGAVGVWQITDWERKRYMSRSRRSDPRHDPLISTEAVAKILRHNYELLGSWPLAITAYNHGLPGMLRARAKTGSGDIAHIVENYDGPLFKFASRNYYAEFLAAHDLIEGGRRVRTADAPAPTLSKGLERAYVGSLTSHKFHRTSCRWVRDIQRARRIWFGSQDEARSRGYVACRLCTAGGGAGDGRQVSVAKE